MRSSILTPLSGRLGSLLLALMWRLVLAPAMSAPTALTTIHFDSGSKALSNGAHVLLDGGSSSDGDGSAVELGYYDAATPLDPFLGNWVALTGPGSRNTLFHHTSIGDSASNGAGAGTLAISLTFVKGSSDHGNDLPAPGTPLAIRFYSTADLTSAQSYNVVSAASWAWKAPQPAPSNSVLSISLDDANLRWLGGNSSAYLTNQAFIAHGSLAFSAPSYAVDSDNGAGAPKTLTVTLQRSNGSAGSVSVEVKRRGGTLLNGANYSFADPTTVSFADGASNATLQIPLASTETNGTIELELSEPSGGASLGVFPTASIQVNNRSLRNLSFAASTYQMVKGAIDAKLLVAVKRIGSSEGAVSVEVDSAGGTAAAGTDFTLPPSPVLLSWADGETTDKTFAITLKSTAQIASSGETLKLSLRNPVGTIDLGPNASTNITFRDLDAQSPSLGLSTPAPGAILTAESLTVTGTASDDQGIARVEISVNHGPAQLATLSGSGKTRGYSLKLLPPEGNNLLTVTAFDLQENPAALERTFDFSYPRTELAGPYNGLVLPGPAAVTPKDNYGLLFLTVTPTGRFSGKFSLGGTSVALRGLFLSDGTARFGTKLEKQLRLTKASKAGRIVLGDLSLSRANGFVPSITGRLASGPNEYASAVAEKAMYNAARVLPLGYKRMPLNLVDRAAENGRYTALLAAGTDLASTHGLPSSEIAQGAGYAQLRLTASGAITIRGRLGDGSPFSYRSRLSGNNRWPFLVALYGKKGLLAGNVQFDPDQSQSDALSTDMVWFRPAGVSAQMYPQGWPAGIGMNLTASKYVAPSRPSARVPSPANPDTVLGAGVTGAIAPTTNLLIGLSDGGLSVVTGNEAMLNSLSQALIAGPSQGATAAQALQLRFVSSGGSFSGSFLHPLSGKAVNFAGVAFQKTNSASGFFLYSPNLSAESALSGSITVKLK